MSGKKKLQVFVSSTFTDLKEERQAAVEAILKAGHIPAGMELFSAGNDSQLETIQRWIDQSDVYMLILGGRYGSVEPKASLGYTELEYDYAISKEIPVFSVVISNEALEEKVRSRGGSVLETEHGAELKLFRGKVLDRISSFFSDRRDIKLAVHETLSDFMARYEFSGWVSGAEVPDATALVEEISRLQRKNALLEKELAALSKEVQGRHPSSKWSDNEFDEIIKLLTEVEVTTDVFSKDDKKFVIPVIKIAHAAKEDFITGIANRSGMSDMHRLFFYNVMPKLQMYGLAATEKVAGVQWQRYKLTDKGLALMAYIDRKKIDLPGAKEYEQKQVEIIQAELSQAKTAD